ncbi:MAG TPA: branched-chain amino acid ABC transporter permease [Jatrophihabitans sp.]|jgi:ABC-type branched-subunit amino acid transport system permease subunit|nr:branched-chain amino acid ABC transporter permease [Jatrophihabitans sp.]
MTTVETPAVVQEVREPWLSETARVLLKRLAACLFGGVVLAIMLNSYEGSQDDFGYVFHQAVLQPRIFVFLAIGVVIFALITFWSHVRQYARRPGVLPMFVGVIVVIVALAIMNWYDPRADVQGSSKFSKIRKLVDQTPSGVLKQTTTLFFDGWLSWGLLGLGLVVCSAAIISRWRPLGYLAALCGVAGAVFAWMADSDILRVGGGIDHSLGVYTAVCGFLILACAGVIAATSRAEVADWRGFWQRIMGYRPGLPFVVVGVVLGLFAYGRDCWFAPLQRNLSFAESADAYSGTDITSLASNYLDWLGWTLFGGVAALTLAATYLRNRLLGWIALVASAVGVLLTFLTLKSMTEVAAKVVPAYGTKWNNLGAGAYLACITYGLFAVAAVYVVARNGRRQSATDANALPVTKAVVQARGSANAKALILLALVLAIFYPPMLSPFWQNVLVSEVSVYLLLAVGLNVVVGWAGLLDLGYIAFYAVGAYTTAYLTGSLPLKPPSWLHMTPLLTIPFAIVACLIAGVLLGTPTLRLRGDYLAIVTLGFGEIIYIIAINNPGKFTNGPQGVLVPHASLHIGSFKITWGQDNLPYWYLLLVLLIIVIVLFYRLENARLGRAWAAIREDEVAAQAAGVNTVRAKILAFAIGASTSGFAGAFFATQVGFFDPTLFTIFASILIVAYVVFGGMGSLPGAMLGAAVLTWLPEFLKSQVPTDDRQMWVGVLVLAMMIFRPAGLLPARRRKAELSGMDAPSSSEVAAVPRAGAA